MEQWIFKALKILETVLVIFKILREKQRHVLKKTQV